MPNAIEDVLKERDRQQNEKGRTAEHDDHHVKGELALAAAAYALHSSAALLPEPSESMSSGKYFLQAYAGAAWPWAPEYWKPKAPRQNLVRAAAMLLAEIDRIDRAEQVGEVRAESAAASMSYSQ